MGEPKCAWAFGSSLRNSSAKDCPAPACVQRDFGLAAGANSNVITDEENADLAVIEAKLADEMIGLGKLPQGVRTEDEGDTRRNSRQCPVLQVGSGLFPSHGFPALRGVSVPEASLHVPG